MVIKLSRGGKLRPFRVSHQSREPFSLCHLQGRVGNSGDATAFRMVIKLSRGGKLRPSRVTHQSREPFSLSHLRARMVIKLSRGGKLRPSRVTHQSREPFSLSHLRAKRHDGVQGWLLSSREVVNSDPLGSAIIQESHLHCASFGDGDASRIGTGKWHGYKRHEGVQGWLSSSLVVANLDPLGSPINQESHFYCATFVEGDASRIGAGKWAWNTVYLLRSRENALTLCAIPEVFRSRGDKRWLECNSPPMVCFE
ncbi:hypothetical protein CEXT_324291 [Caerostris extrusa]|uniref:Uncharacterized protein n=1 Tax=Caerostris extrusa TaxID=172846 RepID=A0AAV4NU56_CAEEX|nr:hypothetical protein CEXT_324291 [Caerostris extrusa]